MYIYIYVYVYVCIYLLWKTQRETQEITNLLLVSRTFIQVNKFLAKSLQTIIILKNVSSEVLSESFHLMMNCFSLNSNR